MTEDERGRLTRRALLRVAGVGVAGALAGCSSGDEEPTPTPTTSRQRRTTTTSGRTPTPTETTAYSEIYDTVVDVVEAGADPTGTTPVNDVLNRVQNDGVAVRFPPGEYRLDPVTLTGTNWGLVGDDATLVIPGGVTNRHMAVDGQGWTVDGFTVDLTADGAAPVNYLSGANWEFKNVEFVGQVDDPETSSKLIYPSVRSSDGTGLVENVVATDGSAPPGESSNRGLTWFGQNNRGTLIWRGCHFAGWANNTLYGANSNGPLVIEDCTFENTNVGVRIGGNTVVRNCTWRQDGPIPTQRWTGGRNARGLWINSNQYVPGEIVVEGCEFLMTGEHASEAINAENPVDDVTVRDTRIRQGSDGRAISVPGDGKLTVERAVLESDATEAGIAIANRDGSTIREACIEKPGVGIRIVDSTGCRVLDSAIDAGGRAFAFAEAEVETRGIRRDADCRSSGSSGGSPAVSPDGDAGG